MIRPNLNMTSEYDDDLEMVLYREGQPVGIDFYYRDVGPHPPTREAIEKAVRCKSRRGAVVNLGDEIGRIAYAKCDRCEWVARLKAF